MTLPTLTIWTLRLLTLVLLYRGVVTHDDAASATAWFIILLTIAYRSLERQRREWAR